MVLSLAPETAFCSVHTTLLTLAVCPLSTLTASPVFKFHTLTFLSLPPDNTKFWCRQTQLMYPVVVGIFLNSSPFSKSQTLNDLSLLLVAKYLPSTEIQVTSALWASRVLTASSASKSHRVTFLSLPPETMLFSSFERAKAYTSPLLPHRVFKVSPDSNSQILMVPSLLPESTNLQSLVSKTTFTQEAWPISVLTHSSKSQILIVESLLPETKNLESLETHKLLTQPLWPSRVFKWFPSLHTLIVSSRPPETTLFFEMPTLRTHPLWPCIL
mmetsp:Transcript_8169/g.12041  ORF Transcript_8169/g.12041 Transcript_8169/m.12041 type:complete len:271 (-) Transcript_8169:2087-2899(-)